MKRKPLSRADPLLTAERESMGYRSTLQEVLRRSGDELKVINIDNSMAEYHRRHVLDAKSSR